MLICEGRVAKRTTGRGIDAVFFDEICCSVSQDKVGGKRHHEPSKSIEIHGEAVHGDTAVGR